MQTLSACTVQLYLYSPYGSYGLCRSSVTVQYSYTSIPTMGRTVCAEIQCLYCAAIPLLYLWAVRPVQSLSACTVQLYLYFHYGPHSLCRPSVPVQYSYTSIPTRAVRPLQSLSACTVQVYLYSHYGPYGLCRVSLPVQYSYSSIPSRAVRPVQTLSACRVQLYQYSHYDRTNFADPQCLYSTAIPLHPLWALRPVQTLSVCTVDLLLYSHYGPYGLCRASVPVQYSYTSIPTMGRTDCTEPQCLYSTAIPLLPLWAVQPLHTLSACTVQLNLYSRYKPYGLYRASVPVQYSYTSTPPMGRTVCTDPQYLYSTAIPLLPL